MPNGRALGTYLNDHLAGATLGVQQARALEDALDGSLHAAAMTRVASEIEEDRETLCALMQRAGIAPNPIKTALAWMTQQVSRLKFSGLTARDRTLGTLLALETMALGVEGKREMWTALARVARERRDLDGVDFERLIARADAQREALESARHAYAEAAFA